MRPGNASSIGRLIARELRSGNKMKDAPTTRETADHAELTRLAEAAKRVRRDSLGRLDGLDASRKWDAFVAAASPATVLALLSEIAALRAVDEEGEVLRQAQRDSLAQAERQRDEAFGLLREIKRDDIHQEGDDIDNHVAGASHHSRAWIGPIGQKIRAFLSNQGADQ